MFYPKADSELPDDRLRALRKPDAPEQTAAYCAALREVCRATFDAAPTSVAPLAEQGTFHRLFRMALADGRSVVARIALGDVSHAADSLKLDAWLHRKLQSEGLPALEVFAVDTSRRSAPFAYELLEEADGVALTEFDADEDRLKSSLRDLGRLLARIHTIGLDGFGPLRPAATPGANAACRGNCDAWHDHLQASLDRHTAVCRNIGAITAYDTRRMERVFWKRDALPEIAGASLLHGDLGSHNVFGDGRRITTLIDWEDSLAGDPIFDVAFWATFHPRPRHAWLLEGYREVAALPDDFDHRFWLYFLRVSLAKTVVRHRLGIVDRPGRPPASQRIQQALAALEGEITVARAA